MSDMQSGQPMPGGPAPAPPATDGGPAKFSAMQRIIGVFTSPSETFADIARKPSAIAPIVLLAVISGVFAWVMNQRIDWASYIRSQAEKSERFAQLSEEQKQRALDPQIKFTPPSVYVFAVLGTPIMAALGGLIWMVAFNSICSLGLKFKQAFGLMAHCCLVGLVSAPLGILSMWFRKYGDVTPENMLASNVGTFLSNDVPVWLTRLGQSLDIFTIWMLVLIALAFSAANPKKAPTGKAMGIVFGVWIFWVLMKVGWAAAFS